MVSSPLWRGGSRPFSPSEEVVPETPVKPDTTAITPGKIDSNKPESPQTIPGKLDSNTVQNIIFNKKKITETPIVVEKKIFAPIEFTQQAEKDKFEPVALSPDTKQTSFSILDLNPTAIATDIVKEVVSATVEKATESLKGFRIKELPKHDMDFASAYYYTNFNDVQPENITIEYNAYLQVIKDLKDGTLKLPENFDGPTIAYDLDSRILKDFRDKNLKYNPEDNLIHRAWYAHCVKRAIGNLREGLFADEKGYKEKRPEVADIIERRVDQIILENTLYKTS